MKKLFIQPQYTREDKADGGIRRVVEAQMKHLPKFGYEVVENGSNADIIAVHGTEVSKRTDVPIVSHCHGLYWDRYNWDDWAHRANYNVRESLRCAVAHTAPSEWVSMSLRRGMMVYPDVIYHGVEPGDFKQSKEHGNFVLWNKARVDPVSSPEDMNKVAELMPNRQFYTTFGKKAPNVIVQGPVPYHQMRDVVSKAGVYLATTRETFGIGTIEAMACGIPVVGWDWGGQSEIIIDDQTGYLVPPHDYKMLANAIERAFNHRSRLGSNAIEDVKLRWLWKDKIQQYADLYTRTLDWWSKADVKVSIIVTCHNLAHYLKDALESVAIQSFSDWECIIVDDFSTDETPNLAHTYIQQDPRFHYYRTRKNLKLVGARNFGVHRSKGRYIMFLDADDMLEEHALEVLTDALDKDSTLHVAYGHLDSVNHEGKEQKRVNWPPDQYSWSAQLAHYNQLPYCSMMRREVFERTGGYRPRQWRAEDAEFWCRATSYGFRAEKVTERSILIYRMRSDSKSSGEPGDGNWCAWFPWGTAEKAGDLPYRRAVEGVYVPQDIVPFGAQDKPFQRTFWGVKDHAYPLISVVIPVGKGHERLLLDALDSLVAQSFINWEAIVVNDTGVEWKPGYGSPVWGSPYAQVIETEGSIGAGAARNLGATYASGEALLFLDADDYLMPLALEKLWSCFVQTGSKSIIYSDWYKNTGCVDELEPHETDDFVCGAVLEKMRHAVTALLPYDAHMKIGGFDESMLVGWEDWDYFIKLQDAGVCSYRVAEPLFVYRFFAGSRREASFADKPNLLQYIRGKWADYYEGRKKMGCGCGGRAKPAPIQKLSNSVNGKDQAAIAELDENATVVLEYVGPHNEPRSYRGPSTGTRYRFGRADSQKQRIVYARDAEHFLTLKENGAPLFKVA